MKVTDILFIDDKPTIIITSGKIDVLVAIIKSVRKAPTNLNLFLSSSKVSREQTPQPV